MLLRERSRISNGSVTSEMALPPAPPMTRKAKTGEMGDGRWVGGLSELRESNERGGVIKGMLQMKDLINITMKDLHEIPCKEPN